MTALSIAEGWLCCLLSRLEAIAFTLFILEGALLTTPGRPCGFCICEEVCGACEFTGLTVVELEAGFPPSCCLFASHSSKNDDPPPDDF